MGDPYKWLCRHACDPDAVYGVIGSNVELCQEKPKFLKQHSYLIWKGIEDMVQKSGKAKRTEKPVISTKTIWLSADLRNASLKEEAKAWGENTDNILVGLIDVIESGASINFKADIEANRIKGMIFFEEDGINYGLSAFGASGHMALVSLLFKWVVMLPDLMEDLDSTSDDFG